LTALEVEKIEFIFEVCPIIVVGECVYYDCPRPNICFDCHWCYMVVLLYGSQRHWFRWFEKECYKGLEILYYYWY